ncbi:winged helix-turn-helix domain-containing protein, partial [Burkholderia cenocepacia]
VLPADAPVKGPKLGPAETKILELIAAEGALTRVQIAAKVAPGKAPQSTYNAVRRLEDKKLVVADGDKYKLPSLGGL